MCGIIGLFTTETSRHDLVYSAVKKLNHRGPDDSGLLKEVIASGFISLGHTRLSIIDVSDQSRQPMISSDGNYKLIFNGEIYNYLEIKLELISHGYLFKTKSDTEVLLYSWIHWGRNCLEKLRGMFSFSILNTKKNSLTLVRDAFGIKPAYYYNNGKELGFASEINALLEIYTDKLKVNAQASYNYLVWGKYDNSEQTFFQDINQLKPGHFIEFDLNSFSDAKPVRWWWPSIAETSTLSFSDASDQLREMFLQNVRIHMRSDVPVGAALSGGLDSSSIVCAMRYLEPDLQIDTFSYIAKGSTNEESWANIVNSHTSAIPHKVSVDAGTLINDIDKMISAQGEPFGSTSIYAQYRLFELVHDTGIKVTLDGQGADEILAGYLGFPGYRMASLLDSRQYSQILNFLKEWSRWPGRTLPVGIMALIEQVIPDELRTTALSAIGQSSAPHWINKTYFQEHNIKFESKPVQVFDDAKNRRLVNALRYRLTSDGLGSLLRHGDRNSMNFSVESRVPFLTTDLAEFLLGLPEDYLISPQGETKHIFRSAMRGIVPNKILDRKDKVGFSTPELQLLIDSSSEAYRWISAAHDIPFLNHKNICHEIEKSLKTGKIKNGYIWRIINFCRWFSIYNEKHQLEY